MFDDSAMGGMGGFNESMNTQNALNSRRRNTDTGILPVTCQDISNLISGETSITVGTKPYNNICVAGRIISVEAAAAHKDFVIDDHTSAGKQVKIRHFTMGDEQETHKEGDIIICYGTIRDFQGETSITAMKIRPISEKEMEVHALEAQYVKLYYLKDVQGKLSSFVHCGGKVKPDDILKFADDNYSPGGASANSGPLKPVNVMKPAGAANQMRNDLCTRLLKQITDHTAAAGGEMNQGLARDVIQKQLRGNSHQAIQAEIDYLTMEGHIYTTIDDDHFASG